MLDKLRLPALPVRRNDHPSGYAVRQRGTVVFPHDIEAAVDTGRRTGGCDEAFIAGIKRIAVQPDLRKASGKILLKFPVRGGSAVIQQSGVGEDISAKTQPCDFGSPLPGSAQRVKQCGCRARLRMLPERHDNDVRRFQLLRPMLHVD